MSLCNAEQISSINNAYDLPDSHIFLTSANMLSQISGPIYSLLGINNITLRRFFKRGGQFYLATNPEWIKHYFAAGYNSFGLFTDFDDAKSPYSLINMHPKGDEHFWCVTKVAVESFALANGFTVRRFYQNYVDVFNFMACPNNTNINNVYWNHIVEIEKFIDYFYVVAADLIAISSQDNNLFYLSKSINFPNNETKLCRQTNFYNTISGARLVYLTKKHSLSPREVECAKMINDGCSAKMIARELNISVRTAEFYTINLKRKLGINTKYQLIKLLKQDL